MSLKDDFLEALNSVKRDLFNGSNGTEPEPDYNENDPPTEMGQALDSSSLGSVELPHKAFYSQPVPEEETVPLPVSDKEAFDSFMQASALAGNDGNNVLEGDASFGEDFSSKSLPSAVHRQSSSEDEVSGLPDSSDGGRVEISSSGYPSNVTGVAPGVPMPAVGSYGNKVYDFERTDLYSDDKTIISKNTVIRGALQTEDSIRLLGQVLGDIDCKSNIVIAGKVRGNTSAANAYVMDAQVDGSLQCDDVVSVSSDAWITGNIRAQQAEIDGKIKGNLDIRHAISIGSTSTIIGDISTDELEVKRGAFVNGNVMMYTPSRDVLDKFDHFEK